MSTLSCETIGRAVLGEPLKREGQELLWRCPNPERHRNGDTHPSFRINTLKNVFACFPCGAKGTPWQLAAFLAGVDPGDKPAVTEWLRERRLLNGRHQVRREDGKRELVAEYVYTDVDGSPVARKLRYEPKSFSWQGQKAGKWVNGLGSVKPPLYRLPEVLAASDVLFVEGEKDADAGKALGLTATTSGATGSWKPEFAETLRRKRVVIIADADVPGRKHAQQVAASLFGKAECIKVLGLPDEKAYAETYAVLGPLIDVARETGTHVLLVHHSGKSAKKDAIDSPLGSTALGGAVSTLIVMQRAEHYRLIQTRQRLGQDLQETVLKFDASTRQLSLGGAKADADREDCERAILEFLQAAAEPQTQDQIRSGVEGKTKVIRSALTALASTGGVAKTGEGTRGKPFLYEFPNTGSATYSETREPESQKAIDTRVNPGDTLVPSDLENPILVPTAMELDMGFEEGEL